jgi:chromate reductase
VTLHGIPLYDGDAEDRDGVPPAVSALAERIRAADGVIISTPEYNFSMPGVLKNATDWLSRGKDHPFRDKRMGVRGASSGPVGTARAQYHLRQNLQALEALVMPRPEIFVANSGQKFDASGRLTDEASLKVVDLWLSRFEAWLRRG